MSPGIEVRKVAAKFYLFPVLLLPLASLLPFRVPDDIAMEVHRSRFYDLIDLPAGQQFPVIDRQTIAKQLNRICRRNDPEFMLGGELRVCFLESFIPIIPPILIK